MSASVDDLIRVTRAKAGWAESASKNTTLTDAFDAFQQERERRTKRLREDTDTYNALRDAGYSPDKAHRAVTQRRFPEDVGGVTTTERVGEAQVKRLEADTERIKKVTETTPQRSPMDTLKSRILKKIADGELLTPGERQVYDEVIKKVKPGSTFDQDFGGGADPDVPVIDPKGRKGFIPQSKLDKALKAGYKRR